MQNNNNVMQKNIDKIQSNVLFDKYVMALQDLNRAEHLETKIKNWKNLEITRYDRVQNCHYFDENNDSQSIDNAKRQNTKGND